MRNIRRIVLHSTSGWNNQTTESIISYWRTPKPKGLGWKQVGYHKLISNDGSIENLAPLSQITNGVSGYNEDSVHICYKGGLIKVDKDSKGKIVKYHYGDTRSQAQKEGFIKAIQEVYEEIIAYNKTVPANKQIDIEAITIVGHRDLSPDLNDNGKIEQREWVKVCPTFNAMDMDEYGWIMGHKALERIKQRKTY